jgi:CubicO group peptidase (beta-lactamase class C family)
MSNFKTITIIYLFIALFSGIVSAAQKQSKSIHGDQLEAKLDGYLSTAAAFGFSGTVLIAKEGKIVLHRGYGMANRENSIHNSKDSVYDIASITKQFTAAAIMKLEMQGKLNTNDLLSKYLPGVPADKSAITMHQVLTHTAGLKNYSGGDYEVATRDETVKRILSAPLESEPGKKFAYSNAGYTLLAAIIERVSGEPYEKFLNRNLFKPAGMKLTGYRLAEWKKTKLVTGYAEGKNQGTPLDHAWDKTGPYWNLFGNGGMLSTAGDLYKWAQALEGEQILSAAAKQKLFAPFLNNYAYGWRVGDTPFGKRIFHGGFSSTGFVSDFIVFPEKNTVIIILTNSIPPGEPLLTRTLVKRFTPAVFGESLPDYPAVKPYKITPAQLKRYEGKYVLPSGEEFIVKANERLSIEAEGQKAVNLLAFPAGSDVKKYDDLSTRAAAIVKGVFQNDYQTLGDELKNPAALERWKGTFERWQTGWKDEAGKVESFEILGTVPAWWEEEKNELATFIRVRLERGSKVFQIFWRNDKLHSLGRGGDESPATTAFAPQTETNFIGYHTELANPVRFNFDLSENGAVTGFTIVTKDGDIVTTRKL